MTESEENSIDAYKRDNEYLDEKEWGAIDRLTREYEKLTEPDAIAKAGNAIGSIMPKQITQLGKSLGGAVAEQRVFEEAMKVIAKGFKIVEQQAAKTTVNEADIIAKVNEIVDDREVTCLEEVCFARSYAVAKLIEKERALHLGAAFVEGAATGAPGFAGIPFNLVLSTFLYYRAVQSVAMYYGYDVKNNPDELAIASEVFSIAMSPSHDGGDEFAGAIGKILVLSEATMLKQTVKKGWQEMASRGGVALLIVQMRALAHKSAQKALQKAGEQGIEGVLFRSVFEQIGKKLTQKAVQRAIPVVSAALGAAFDTAQMNTVIGVANVFYHKRFIAEKAMRIQRLEDPDFAQVELVECVGD